MNEIDAHLISGIQNTLNKKVVEVVHKGQGCANDAYYLKTENNAEYLLKCVRKNVDTPEQNDLHVESSVIKYLNEKDPALPIPKVVYVSNEPAAYVYKYITGSPMIYVWNEMREECRVRLSTSIGAFHAQTGEHISQSTAQKLGIRSNTNPNIIAHEMSAYKEFLTNPSLPESAKEIARQAAELYNSTSDIAVYHFLHNDVHNENIIVNNTILSGVIDFGDCEYGDVHRDFFQHVRRYPNYLDHFINGYQKVSNRELSRKRIISYAILRDLREIADYYNNPEKERRERTQVPDTYTVRDRLFNYDNLIRTL